jgi:hypothetical protein
VVLTVITSLLWWIAWFLINVNIFGSLSSDADVTSQAYHVHGWVYESLLLCKDFPQLEDALGLGNCLDIPLLVMGVILYLLSLTLAMIAPYRPGKIAPQNEAGNR